jgi:predicted ABC-class ATPase
MYFTALWEAVEGARDRSTSTTKNRQTPYEATPSRRTMRDLQALRDTLERIDGKGYKAYNDIRGEWAAEGFTLAVEHVQRDPFASPSRIRIDLPTETHRLPRAWWRTAPRRIGLEDHLLRRLRSECKRIERGPGSGKSGSVQVHVGGPQVLERGGCHLDEKRLTLRLRVGLPAQGRRVLGRAAARILTEGISKAVMMLTLDHLEPAQAAHAAEVCEDHHHLVQQLSDHGLVAFVADGSILPRASGISTRPMKNAVAFRSPPELKVTLTTANQGEVTGMGIPRGVTVITGGGFHGKTTLLEALQAGIHPHAPGDGRERVATVPDAVKVRSEDGRAVTDVDLRPFIHDLPRGRDTRFFTTEDASGSTSLAASILEALEVGTSLLLIDEDTSATNLLVRDARMQALVEHETITPLIDRVHQLKEKGTSTILVTGGSGDYLDVADTVILLDDYDAHDATHKARATAEGLPTNRQVGDPRHPLVVRHRRIDQKSLDPRGRRGKTRAKARGRRTILYGESAIDVSHVEQFFDEGQLATTSRLLAGLFEESSGDRRTIRELVTDAVAGLTDGGLGRLDPAPELTMVRPLEVAAAINRYRGLRIHAPDSGSQGERGQAQTGSGGAAVR